MEWRLSTFDFEQSSGRSFFDEFMPSITPQTRANPASLDRDSHVTKEYDVSPAVSQKQWINQDIPSPASFDSAEVIEKLAEPKVSKLEKSFDIKRADTTDATLIQPRRDTVDSFVFFITRMGRSIEYSQAECSPVTANVPAASQPQPPGEARFVLGTQLIVT